MAENLKSELLSKFPSLFDSRGRTNANLVRSAKSAPILEEMMASYSSDLTGQYLLSERIVMLFNNIDKRAQHCEVCGKSTALDTVNKVFRRWCSVKCAHESDTVKNKTKQTCIERYGHSTNLMMPEARKSYFNKYGGFGMASSKIRDKVESTVMKKYGVVNVWQAEKVIEQIKNTHHVKYGRMYSQQHISDESMVKLNDSSYCQMVVDEQFKTFTQFAEELGVTPSTLLKYVNKHGISYTRKCSSVIEGVIDNWLTEKNIIHTRNDRTVLQNMEVDFYIPAHNVAIELNGVYWHSDSNINDRHYHFKKSNAAREGGIQLLSFWEHETINKLDIVKSMILNKCGMSKRIFARHCVISQLSIDQRRVFFETNHLSGDSNCNSSWGLFNKGILVAAISLGKARFENTDSWEIIRYANVLNHSITGGFSKLFKHAVTELNIDNCITYASGQISATGNVYLRTGFIYDSLSSPGYFYFKNDNTGNIVTMSRYMAQKSKLVTLLDNYDESKSEYENMINHKWYRVWDMGNHKLRWSK